MFLLCSYLLVCVLFSWMPRVDCSGQWHRHISRTSDSSGSPTTPTLPGSHETLPIGRYIWCKAYELANFPLALHLFDEEIIQRNLPLTAVDRIGFIFDACLKLGDIKFAEKVWDHMKTREKIDEIKPNQLLYSKMLQIYNSYKRKHRKVSSDYLSKAINITNKWIGEYKTSTGQAALQKGLTKLSIHDPIILNQLIRIITASRVQHKSPIIQHYFRKMIELKIVPDSNTLALIKSKGALTPEVCIGFVEASNTSQIANIIFHELLIPLLPDRKIREFDCVHKYRVFEHLQYLCTNHPFQSKYYYHLYGMGNPNVMAQTSN